jgi:lysozyme
MQMSTRGLADLELHEGVVLKAYRCPAGRWTIGCGLTAGSGVVTPGPGMVITKAEATNMLQAALSRNYEPRVAKAMPGAAQHEFDAGTGFDFNTGAVHKAGWVKSWLKRDWPAVRKRLGEWCKGGGRVLPGLVRRREAEYQMMRYAHYASGSPPAAPVTSGAARIALPLSGTEIAAAREGFRLLGFDPGDVQGTISRQAAIAFQVKHGLIVDGIVGRATLSTLQRALDARAKAAPATGGVFVAGGATTTGADDALAGLPYLTETVLAGAMLYALWLAWRYRDQIAATVQRPLPRVAAFLRSF